MRKALIYLCCMLFCCMLFIYSEQAVSAGIQGFYVWRDRLLPALLPFFVLAHIMQNTGLPSRIERAGLILLSLFSGAPSGARLLSADGKAHSPTVAILNTVSPVFIYASFCSGMLGTPYLALPILAAQLSSAAIMLLIFPPVYSAPSVKGPAVSPLRLLGEGISKGMASMLGICGALVFFMALLAAIGELLPLPGGIAGALLTGALEMVSGCKAIATLPLSPAATAAASAFILSFGGICIFAQSLTFCQLDAKVYFLIKLLQGTLAALITWLITPLFRPAAAVYNSISTHKLLINTLSFGGILGVSSLAMAFVMLIGAAARHRKFFSGNIKAACGEKPTGR